ncbi:YfiR family protein [Flammeovirgaceae bacterium SG7u.111]|nr:YfiR family protein [Flammeovirgaceae bacterium SG7u.132]WPO37049.1 YfiR family protein [Flammeovirgaceae bacterium SG7u.111]
MAISWSILPAQTSNRYEIRKMFMYHFFKYIEWPDDNSASGEFVIAVAGDDQMAQVLSKNFNSFKRHGKKKYVVRSYDSFEQVKDCHVLFLGRSQSKYFEDVKGQFEGKSTLLITDRNGLGDKGSCINFKEQGNKLQFELNVSSLDKAKLKVAGQLRQVAILI